MSVTLDETLTRWLLNNMGDKAYSPAGLARLAIDEGATPLENWARLRLALGRLVKDYCAETKVQYQGSAMLDGWWKTNWVKVLRLRLGRVAGPSGAGRPRKYLFVIGKVKDKVIYTSGLLASLISESDLAWYNQKYDTTLNLFELQKRARIALSIFRSTHITVPPSGTYKAIGQGEYDGWCGEVWLSAFGFLSDNNLHMQEGKTRERK